MRILIILSTVALSVMLSLPLHGQSSLGRPSVIAGAGGGWFSVGGDDFGDIDDAPGLGGYVGVHLTGSLNLLGGVHYSSHEATPAYDLTVLGIYLEPRFLFDQGDRLLGWFIGGRLAWVQREVYTLSSDGYALGGIVGMVIGTDWPVRIEPALTATALSFSSFSGSGDRATGTSMSLQIGLSIPISRAEK
jgi:hypothetical protein